MVAMLLVLPTNAPRYWWPLVPLQLLALGHGVRLLWRFRPLPAVGAAVVVALFIAAVARSAPEPSPSFAARPELRALMTALEQQAVAEPVRVSFFSPRLFTWHTRIPAMGHFVATPDETLQEMRRQGITHLVLGSYGELPPSDSSLQQALAGHPEGYERMEDYGPLTVYRVRR